MTLSGLSNAGLEESVIIHTVLMMTMNSVKASRTRGVTTIHRSRGNILYSSALYGP